MLQSQVLVLIQKQDILIDSKDPTYALGFWIGLRDISPSN